MLWFKRSELQAYLIIPRLLDWTYHPHPHKTSGCVVCCDISFRKWLLTPSLARYPSLHSPRPPLQHLPAQYPPGAWPEGLALPSYNWDHI